MVSIRRLLRPASSCLPLGLSKHQSEVVVDVVHVVVAVESCALYVVSCSCVNGVPIVFTCIRVDSPN